MSPEPSLPIRAAGRAKKRSAIARVADSSSSPLQPPPPSQKRLRRRSPHDDDDDDEDNEHSLLLSPRLAAVPSSPTKKRKRTRAKFKVRDMAAAARLNPWIDVEAGHSGDEVSSGRSGASSNVEEDEDEDEESESDRRFVTDLPPTQPSPSSSYDQAAVYRQSLLSQAPVLDTNTKKRSLPVFAAPPRRHGVRLGVPTGAAAAVPAHPAPGVLDPSVLRRGHVGRFSSPAAPVEDDEDYYMFGSFVVDDEAEISFLQSSNEP